MCAECSRTTISGGGDRCSILGWMNVVSWAVPETFEEFSRVSAEGRCTKKAWGQLGRSVACCTMCDCVRLRRWGVLGYSGDLLSQLPQSSYSKPVPV